MTTLILLTDSAERMDIHTLRDALAQAGHRFARPSPSLDNTMRLTSRAGDLAVTRVNHPYDDPDFDMALVDAASEQTAATARHRRYWVIKAEHAPAATAAALILSKAIPAQILWSPDAQTITHPNVLEAGPTPPNALVDDTPKLEGTTPAQRGLERIFFAFQGGYSFLGSPLGPDTLKRKSWQLSLFTMLVFPVIGVISAGANLIFGANHGRSKLYFLMGASITAISTTSLLRLRLGELTTVVAGF